MRGVPGRAGDRKGSTMSNHHTMIVIDNGRNSVQCTCGWDSLVTHTEMTHYTPEQVLVLGDIHLIDHFVEQQGLDPSRRAHVKD